MQRYRSTTNCSLVVAEVLAVEAAHEGGQLLVLLHLLPHPLDLLGHVPEPLHSISMSTQSRKRSACHVSQSARVIVRGTVINQEAGAEGAYGGLDGVGPGPAGAWGRRRGRGPGLGGDGEHAAEAALVLVRGVARERGDEPGHDAAPAEPPSLQQVQRGRRRRRCRRAAPASRTRRRRPSPLPFFFLAATTNCVKCVRRPEAHLCTASTVSVARSRAGARRSSGGARGSSASVAQKLAAGAKIQALTSDVGCECCGVRVEAGERWRR